MNNKINLTKYVHNSNQRLNHIEYLIKTNKHLLNKKANQIKKIFNDYDELLTEINKIRDTITEYTKPNLSDIVDTSDKEDEHLFDKFYDEKSYKYLYILIKVSLLIFLLLLVIEFFNYN